MDSFFYFARGARTNYRHKIVWPQGEPLVNQTIDSLFVILLEFVCLKVPLLGSIVWLLWLIWNDQLTNNDIVRAKWTAQV